VSAATMTPDATDPSGHSWLLSPKAGTQLVMRVARHGVDRTATPTMMTVTGAGAKLVTDIGSDRLDRALLVSIEMKDVVVQEDTGGQRSERSVFRAVNLGPADDLVGAMLKRSGPELLEQAKEAAAGRDFAGETTPSPALQAAMDDLDKSMRKLNREVTAKRHERMAMAASCFVMVVAGAVIALRLSRRLPMTVYMFTFVPAVICIVTISGGQQLTVQSGTPGLLLMWSGVAGLLLYAWLQLRSLAKH
jgi:Lipopolysaccharide export system permease LptF/LptG